ncbi:MAG: Hsp70 family protein [Deltaproteobacteria bacterium]|nr:MAG: Hsp70 family protein [Deltaproteobacteria bacterium]
MTKVFGIDLGTTYSCIAYVDEHGKPVVIPNSENQRVTPSVVLFEGNNIIVGKDAKDNALLSPNETVAFVKRSMGDPNFVFVYNGKDYRPEEISSFILRKLVGDAEQITGEKITDVVITCPAYFGINEREATRLAGEIAGLNVRQIINEPTAAAIHYGTVESEAEKVVLVYDLGGGTFDITMIHIKPGDLIQVVCTGGDHNLGGKDWDDTVVQYLVEQFQEQTGTSEDILEDSDTCQELQQRAENAKMSLTNRDKTGIPVTHGGERAKVELTREKFDELTRNLLERTISLTHEMLGEARKKGYDAFDEILLVGGSVKMPQIADRVAEEFSVVPIVFDPDEAVAKGAAFFGWKLAVDDELVHRIAESTGKTVEEIQSRPEDIPDDVSEQEAQQLADDMGFTLAAVKQSRVSIKNVTSKSFGVVAITPEENEIVINLILKNATVPADITRRFGTHLADQETTDIRIMENEVSDSDIPPDQALEIGTAVLDLPTGLPARSPIDITFKLNEEGRLEMTAVEVTESRTVGVTVETSSVIQGEELEEAKARKESMVVS